MYLTALFIRIVFAAVRAGIICFAWMCLFFLLRDSIGSLVTGVFRVAAPVATAVGLGTGVFIHEHVIQVRNVTWPSVLVWPLSSCAVGAVAIYWCGPMLIVSGVFATGTASVVLRELVLCVKECKNRLGPLS